MGWVTQGSLRVTLLIAFLVIGLVPLASMGVLAYRSAEASLIDRAGHRLGDVAFNAIDKLDRNLFERYGDVQAFAQSDPARSMEPARITSWINTMMGTYTPIYKLMVVADAQGKIIAVNTVNLEGKPLAGSQTLLGRSVSSERWFRDAIDGKVKDGASLVEDLHRDDLMGAVYGTTDRADLAMSFTAPIKDKNGVIIGVWTNRFNWNVATAILKEVEQRALTAGMASVKVVVAGANGQALVAPTSAEILTASYGDRASLKSASREAIGRAEGPGLASRQPALEAAAVSAGYSTYAGLGWRALATQDMANVVEDAAQLRLITLGTGLAATVLIVLFAWLVAGVVGRRVVAVAATARQIAEEDLPSLILVLRALGGGDFSQRVQVTTGHVNVSGQDEIGVMASNFNQMIDELHKVGSACETMAVSVQEIVTRRAARRAVNE